MAPSVEALGRRLGDLIATLCDFHHFNRIIITGGVLSGGVRSLVVAGANARLLQYGINLIKTNSGSGDTLDAQAACAMSGKDRVLLLLEETHSDPASPDQFEVDSGPFGAAMGALSAFLNERQQLGRRQLTALVGRLHEKEKMVLENHKDGHALVMGRDNDHFDLESYAMTFEDATQYIEANASELQLYLEARSIDRVAYVYWPYAE